MAPVPPAPPSTSTASASSTSTASAPSTAHDILGAVALVSAPSTMADLSGPARALLGALDEGLGAAVGLTTSLSSAGTDAVATLAGNLAGDLAGALGDNVAEIVGDCIEALPVVGAVAKAVVSILTLGLSLGPTDAELCQRLWDRYRPTQTGSALAGGVTVPADLFARVHGVEVYGTDNPDDYAAAHERFRQDPRALSPGLWFPSANFLEAGPIDYRSTLAMSWMQVVEGSIADVRDYDWRAFVRALEGVLHDEERPLFRKPAHVAHLWQRAVDRDRRIARAQWAHDHGEQLVGLSPETVATLRALRRGIEAMYGPSLPAGSTSDGGAALWIAALDLVTSAFDRGALSWQHVEWLFARQGRFARRMYAFSGADNHTWHRVVEPLLQRRPDADYLADTGLVAAPPTWIWVDDPCPSETSSALKNMISTWHDTMHPYYDAGQQSVQELERQARAVGRAAGRRQAARRTVSLPSSAATASTSDEGPAPVASSGPAETGQAEMSASTSSPLLGIGILATLGLALWAATRGDARIKRAPWTRRWT
jgi:hypothetical protein